MTEPSSTARFHELIASGLTRSALGHARRSGRLDRPFRGVYIPSGLLNQRALVHAACLHLGPEAVPVSRSAILLHGIAGLVGANVPEISMPPGMERRQRTGVNVRFWDIPAEHLTEIDGLRVTTLSRTLSDILRETNRMEAVACVDNALNRGLITVDDLPEIEAMMAGKRGCVSGRKWLGQARPGAASPLETRVRIRADDGGLPPDQLQVPIYDEFGTLLGFGDMGWRLADGTWLIAEADGREFHDTPEALLYDRRRQNAFLAAANAQVVRFTWEDTGRPGDIDAVIRPILTRGGWKGFKPVRP